MIRRNVASQVIYLPALLLTADGSAVTTGATLTVAKDGTESASAGTLAHSAGGVWKYTPTQSETNCAIVGLILTATSATPVVLNLVTTAVDTSVANVPANVTQISGDSTAADNLETACDGGSFNIGGGGVVAASVAAGVTLAATTHTGAVIPTVTNLTNLPSIPAGWLTASGIAAAALNGKGDWATSADVVGLIGEGGIELTSIPWNTLWDAEVQSECTDALNAYDGPTKAEQDAAFTEIKGAGWLSTTDTMEKIRDASGGGGGSTVQINPIAISTGGPAEAPLMTCHQGEYGDKAFLFYDLDAYGQRSATDFSSYTHLRLGVALPTGTAWIETADITVVDNQLTFPIGDLTGDVGTFEATLWDWVGAGATDQRLVVACAQFVVTEAVGADEVTA